MYGQRGFCEARLFSIDKNRRSSVVPSPHSATDLSKTTTGIITATTLVHHKRFNYYTVASSGQSIFDSATCFAFLNMIYAVNCCTPRAVGHTYCSKHPTNQPPGLQVDYVSVAKYQKHGELGYIMFLAKLLQTSSV